MTDEACGCFKQIDPSLAKNVIFEKFIDECFVRIIEQFEPELVKIKDTIQGESDYQKGVEFGKTIGLRTQSLMIHRCDPFFYFIENLKKEMFQTADIDKEKLNIAEKSKQLAVTSSEDILFDRAMSYYKIKQFKLARRDLGRILKSDRYNVKGLLLRGFVYDQTGKYKKAISDYQECKRLTGKPEIVFFIAIAERKGKM